jgi:hypothetical protein
VSSGDKATFATAISIATTVKDNTNATNDDLNAALTALATAKSTFEAAQKHGYGAVENSGLKITPIYRGFQVEPTSDMSTNSLFLLCDGVPLSYFYYYGPTRTDKYIFQGSKFESGSHVFTVIRMMDDSQIAQLTVHAVDVSGGTGSDATHLYHTNIDSVNFAFNSPTWQLTRAAEPVKNDTWLPNANLSSTNSEITSYGYISGTYRFEKGSNASWTSNTFDIWSWLSVEEMVFSYQIRYDYTDSTRYVVYAGNTEHQSYPEPQTMSASGTIELNITGLENAWNMRLGLFKDASCAQAIDSADGWISASGSSNWNVRVLASNPDIASGTTVYFGVILDGSNGEKIIPVSGKSLTIQTDTNYYQDINLGTVTGSYP